MWVILVKNPEVLNVDFFKQYKIAGNCKWIMQKIRICKRIIMRNTIHYIDLDPIKRVVIRNKRG